MLLLMKEINPEKYDTDLDELSCAVLCATWKNNLMTYWSMKTNDTIIVLLKQLGYEVSEDTLKNILKHLELLDVIKSVYLINKEELKEIGLTESKINNLFKKTAK